MPKPYDVMRYEVNGVVHPPKSRDAGLGLTLVGWKQSETPHIWAIMARKGRGKARPGLFHAQRGTVWIPTSRSEVAPAMFRAKGNPRGVFGRGGGGRSFTSRSSTTSALQPVLTSSGQALQMTPAVPSGGRGAALAPYYTFPGSSSDPLTMERIDPSQADGYQPEVPQTVDEPYQSKLPERDIPAGTIKAAAPDDWLPKTKRDIYSRASAHGSTAAGSAGAGSGMKDLIDPQLWRLADGGSFPAMVELQRRGPAHWRPASPNPRARGNPRGLRDIEFLMAEDGHEFSQYDLERRGQWHIRSPRTVENIPGIRNPSKRGMSPAVVHHMRHGAQPEREITRHEPDPPGPFDPSKLPRLPTGKPQSQWEKRKREQEARAAAALREATRLTPDQLDRAVSQSLRKTRRNPTPSRQYSFTQSFNEGGDEWAEWALGREGIPHRNPKVGALTRQGRGMTAAQSIRAREMTVKALMKARGLSRKQAEAFYARIFELEPAKAASNPRGWRQPSGYTKASLPSLGSGRKGGYTQAERDALPSSWFLKPRERAWPVADPAHVKIALQYMTAGRGRPSEYPALIKRLATLWPVAKHPALWAIYSKNKRKIEAKYGKKLPTLAQLRRS